MVEIHRFPQKKTFFENLDIGLLEVHIDKTSNGDKGGMVKTPYFPPLLRKEVGCGQASAGFG
jgi:hypothetical protein